MMVGGAGVLAVLILVAIVVIGPVVWKYLPALLAAIAVGTLVGFLAAWAVEARALLRPRLPRSASSPRSPRRSRSAASSELACPFCGGPITEEQAVCPHCFRDLKRNCPRCGAVIDVWAVRCPACGIALSPAEESPSARRAPISYS